MNNSPLKKKNQKHFSKITKGQVYRKVCWDLLYHLLVRFDSFFVYVLNTFDKQHYGLAILKVN
jgi:hypothetical protein